MSDLQDSLDWDEDRADWLVGKVILVGITRLASDGETVTSQDQFHGVVESVDGTSGITIACAGQSAGETLTLPPTISAFEDAPPGEYRLRSTGEVIVDPDITTSWTIQEPSN